MTKHYGDENGLLVLSRNAVFTAVLTNRNFGKTWTFKKRAFRRAMKHGNKTIWLRMFKKEAQECVATFFGSSDLQAYAGIRPYDKEHCPDGNFKQNGSTFYYRNSPRSQWRWFLKVFALSDAGAIRSADDAKVDTIIFDEFTKPTQMYKRYHGNIATDFLDIFFSLKREHEVRCVFLGNKESFSNPIFDYFGIKPLPTSYEGIRAYRKGSFVLQQINNLPNDDSRYGKGVQALLKGTSYGNYIYESEYRNAKPFKNRKTPPNCPVYCQVYINGHSLKISVSNGLFYVNGNIDKGLPIYCDVPPHRWIKERQLVKRQKQYFLSLVNAIADNRIYYDTPANHEAMQSLYQWLGI